MYLSIKTQVHPPSDSWLMDSQTAMVEIADIGTQSSSCHIQQEFV